MVITNSKATGDACNGPDVLQVEVASCRGPVGCLYVSVAAGGT